jgi:hypothetical protein
MLVMDAFASHLLMQEGLASINGPLGRRLHAVCLSQYEIAKYEIAKFCIEITTPENRAKCD